MSHQKKERRFDNVVDMIRDALPEDSKLADELSEQISQRQLVRRLANLRNINGISQEDVAKQRDCGQSRISKLENGIDADVTMADLKAYAEAAGFDLGIVFRSKKLTLVNEVKRHAHCIKHCFDKMNELAEHDEIIAKGVADFHIEALINLMNIVQTSSSSLSRLTGNGDPLHITVQQADGEDSDCEQPLRIHRQQGPADHAST